MPWALDYARQNGRSLDAHDRMEAAGLGLMNAMEAHSPRYSSFLEFAEAAIRVQLELKRYLQNRQRSRESELSPDSEQGRWIGRVGDCQDAVCLWDFLGSLEEERLRRVAGLYIGKSTPEDICRELDITPQELRECEHQLRCRWWAYHQWQPGYGLV